MRGVIEGFYGRPLDWSTRHAWADYLQQVGLDSYIYCPKADNRLRRHWQQSWPQDVYRHLEALSGDFRQRELCFGLGLSPYALYQRYGARERAALRARLDEIESLQPSLLAVLFDDMPGALPDLAQRQAEILCDIRSWLPQLTLLTCPTYYSFDPVLQRHFGVMPEDYWEQFGRRIPADVDVFWTGPKVCSDCITQADIDAAVQALGRPVVLWDNYPVNDGAIRSRRLYLQPLSDRPPAGAAGLNGHFCNLMNQGWLSMLPLLGLAGRDAPAATELFGSALAGLLARDAELFQQRGLDAIAAAEAERLALEYASLAHPAAGEVAQWLRGEYHFDPACLTD